MTITLDEALVKDVLATFVEGWNNHDHEALSELYDDDAHVSNSGGAFRGRQDVLQFYWQLFHDSEMSKAQLSNLKADMRFLRPDVAIAHIFFEIVKEHWRSGEAHPTGMLVHTLIKNDEEWRVVETNTILFD